ncbi:MAG: SDR family oxidoreductase [Halofilum sp. (in: g-proteobacteria)]|nr:SDR family oxidoreductase [Halofilum sp. (in: g-proteobacteria)]
MVALENAHRGITCNAICPGWVETPLIRPQIEHIAERDGISIDAAKVELVRHKQPSRQFVQPGQIGSMAVYLVDAAVQITGTSLSIDGVDWRNDPAGSAAPRLPVASTGSTFGSGGVGAFSPQANARSQPLGLQAAFALRARRVAISFRRRGARRHFDRSRAHLPAGRTRAGRGR